MAVWQEMGVQVREVRADLRGELSRERRVVRALGSLLGGYLVVGVVLVAALSRRTDHALLLGLAPVSLVISLVAAVTAMGVLLVFRSRRYATPAMATFGASTAVAATALGAMFVAALP